MVRLPVVIGPKSYEHDFCVLDESEADCLIGLDFLETIVKLFIYLFVKICI